MHQTWATRTALASSILFSVFATGICNAIQEDDDASNARSTTKTIRYSTHDGHELFGKLTLPTTRGPHPVVIYVQTAEGMTVNMRRPKGNGETFDYFDLYAEKLPQINVAFFRYEGRGISMGDKPPRYENIDREVFNTSTLDNKVRDILTSINAVKLQPGIDTSKIYLMGASEGSLLAAEAAHRAPRNVAGLILYGVMSGNLRESMKFIFGDGGFLAYRQYFDTDKDEKISKDEFEADPRKYRERVFKNAAFETFDRDKDGFYTVDDFKIQTKPLLHAIDNNSYVLLNLWAKTSAGVSTPDGWFEDHFSHDPIWTFLSELEIPIGIFHGGLDTSCSIQGVRQLQQLAKDNGKDNIQFQYFDDLDHTLDIAAYFFKGELPAGHQAIFKYIEEQVK